MKILYIHQYFNTPEMSGGTRSFEFARRLVASGHEVHMITSYTGETKSNSWFETFESGIHVYWLPVSYSNHMNYFDRIKAFFNFANKSKNKAIDIGGDVVFATSTPLTIAIPGVIASKRLGIPMVFEVRDLWPELPIAIGALKSPLTRLAARWLEKWAYSNSSSIVALSPGMKEGVVKAGFDYNRVAVIPNSSDNYEFQYQPNAECFFREQRNWLGNSPLLVYTGTFGKINGVGYIVALAKCLVDLKSDIKILLVGDGQERELVIQKAKDAGVYNVNVFFETKIPKRDMPALLSAATIASSLFIDLPEMRANSANKFFDALASGTPVFINYGGWMHELVEEHNCGLAMWGLPIDEVAQTLHSKMHDVNWLLENGIAARQLAEKKFDRDILANQLIEVIQLTVKNRSDEVSAVAPGSYTLK